MFTAHFRPRRALVLAVLATAVAWTATSFASAAEAQKVLRYFIVFASPDYPDFESQESVAVVAHGEAGAHGMERFRTCERNPEWLRGTWWSKATATHAAVGGPPAGDFAWLDPLSLKPEVQLPIGDIEDLSGERFPPNGAFAKAGTSGDIIVLNKRFAYKELDSLICGTDCGWKFWEEGDESYPTAFILICAGWFTK